MERPDSAWGRDSSPEPVIRKKATKKIASKKAAKVVKKVAKKTPGGYRGESFDEWFEDVKNPLNRSRSYWTTSGTSPSDRSLVLDFNYEKKRVSRFCGEDFGAAPFPNDSPLEWSDAIGLFVDESMHFLPCLHPSTTFWTFEPKKGQLEVKDRETRMKELFILRDGMPVVDFTKPILHVRVSVRQGRASRASTLAVPGEVTSSWALPLRAREFHLSSLLLQIFDWSETQLGYYREGPISIRAIKGDRFYGLTFEAFMNCTRGKLKTHNFEWA